MVDPIRPVLRADSPAAQVVRDLSLGERVGATVLSDLGNGIHEVRLGGRVLRVQSPQRLDVGDALVLAVREVRSRLALEILEIRPAAGSPTPDAVLSGRLSALGVADTAESRDALRAVLGQGLAPSRAALEQVVEAGREFPASEALARRAAAFLLAAGVQPARGEILSALMGAVRGGSLGTAVASLQELEASPDVGDLAKRLLHDLGWKGSEWSAPGEAEKARALATVERELGRLLAAEPRLAELDRAMAEAKPGEIPALALKEREVLDSLPWLRPLREAHQALARSHSAEEGRLLLGRDGTRYAEGVYRPAEGEAAPMRLRVAARSGGGGSEGRKGPLKVAIGLNLSALGGVGARLTAKGRTLGAELEAERPDTEGILRERAPELASALRALGFEASVTVRRVEAEALEAGFYPELSGGGEPAPLVDLKA